MSALSGCQPHPLPGLSLTSPPPASPPSPAPPSAASSCLEEPEENQSKEEKQEPGTPMRKAGRPGRKRKHAQVESSDTPKDIAAVPKCPPPCPEASPAEPLPNGDVEGDGAQWKGAEEGSTSPKGGRPEEDETESLPDGETGRALENGRCTPKEGLDAPADEGELAPSDPQKKRHPGSPGSSAGLPSTRGTWTDWRGSSEGPPRC
uniref:DNA (cytosine-5)-methyltransferase N-terminal domain-containing protein n=1 Tax=Accipiter nisus TaxID=211598 RepID=A0A8B9RUK2_9AVES